LDKLTQGCTASFGAKDGSVCVGLGRAGEVCESGRGVKEAVQNNMLVQSLQGQVRGLSESGRCLAEDSRELASER
jgi:hypothetical protein